MGFLIYEDGTFLSISAAFSEARIQHTGVQRIVKLPYMR